MTRKKLVYLLSNVTSIRKKKHNHEGKHTKV